MIIRPLQDRVVIRRLEQERTSAGGIVIPDTASEKPDQGDVIAVGPGKVGDDGKKRAIELKVGDRVLFGKYAGSNFTIDGEELTVMREDDVLGIIEGSKSK